MPTHYALVDFENVQPDLASLAGTPYKVKVFFGAKQQEGRVPFKLMDALLALGGNVEMVKVARSGKNALDMHIAYYIGDLLAREPGASIHIISGDTDFDPLLEFLRAKGVACKRTKTIGELAKQKAPHAPAPSRAPAPRAATSAPKAARPPRGAHAPKPAPVIKPAPDQLASIVKQLRSMNGKPASRKKLAQTIATWFKQHGGEESSRVVEQAIEELIRQKYVSQAGAKVNYNLG